MIKKVFEDLKFAATVILAIAYFLLLDLAFQTRFSKYHGEIIMTYTKYQRVLSNLFFPLLIFGISVIGLFVYSLYLDVKRNKKRYRHV